MDYLEMEYTALRNEILKRIELRHQIIVVTLTIAGVFLGGGVQQNNAFITLVYPPLATFLAVSWAQNDHRIRDLAGYIRNYIEPFMSKDNIILGWETYMQKIRFSSGPRISKPVFNTC